MRKLSNWAKPAALLTLVSLAFGGVTPAVMATATSRTSNVVGSETVGRENSFQLAQRGECRRVVRAEAGAMNSSEIPVYRNPNDIFGGTPVATVPVGRTVNLAVPRREMRVADANTTSTIVMVAVTQADSQDLLWIPANSVRRADGRPMGQSNLGYCDGSTIRGLW